MIKSYSKQKYDSLYDPLPVIIQSHHGHSVCQDAYDQYANRYVAQFPDAACKAHTAKNDCSDNIHFIAIYFTS